MHTIDQQTAKWFTSDFWQFIGPWHRWWYEYDIFIASSTDNIYGSEKKIWLFGEVVDHVGIYGYGAEGLSTFNFGLVITLASTSLLSRVFAHRCIQFRRVYIILILLLIVIEKWMNFYCLSRSQFSCKEIDLKMSSTLWRLFCFDLAVLKKWWMNLTKAKQNTRKVFIL